MSAAMLIVCDVCSLGLPLLLVIWLLRHRGDYVPSTDVSRLGNVIVKGVVEADAAPVTIDYVQERSSVSRTSAGRRDAEAIYEWEETKRTIKGTPFVLRSGDLRIHVDPDEDDVSLLWDPDHPVNDGEYTYLRTRRAILEPGAAVEIFGRYTPEGATLVPTRVERLLISKRPIAPKFVAMRRYLALRAGVTVALAGLAHVAIQPVWEADIAQLGIATPSYEVRGWIGIAFAALAYYLARTKRPWNLGKVKQLEVITKRVSSAPASPRSGKKPSKPSTR